MAGPKLHVDDGQDRRFGTLRFPIYRPLSVAMDEADLEEKVGQGDQTERCHAGGDRHENPGQVCCQQTERLGQAAF